MGAVAWHDCPGEVDRFDLQEELERFLYHGPYWADLPLEPDPTVYVEDEYFSLEATERDLDLVEDPTDELEVQQQDLAVAQILDADLTDKQEATVRETMDNGGVREIDELANEAGVSESTVRRTFRKLDQLVEIAAGKVRPADRVVADKVRDVFASIDQMTDQGMRALRGMGGRGELVDEDSALGKWARRYGVQVDESDPDAIEVAINLGELTEYQATKLIRAGREAARAVGPRTHNRFVKAHFFYTGRDGERHRKGFGKFGWKYRIS